VKNIQGEIWHSG